MAALNTNRPVVALSAGRVSHYVADFFGTISAWNDARITRKSLSQLSSRELDDIGLAPGDIDAIAKRPLR